MHPQLKTNNRPTTTPGWKLKIIIVGRGMISISFEAWPCSNSQSLIVYFSLPCNFYSSHSYFNTWFHFPNVSPLLRYCVFISNCSPQIIIISEVKKLSTFPLLAEETDILKLVSWSVYICIVLFPLNFSRLDIYILFVQLSIKLVCPHLDGEVFGCVCCIKFILLAAC